jgi:rhodanese-related sulfurtransferase
MKIINYVVVLMAFSISCSSTVKNAGTNNTATNDGIEETEQSEPKANVQNINQQTFAELLADTNVVVIDVRTAGEVSNGFIKGADLFIDVNSPDFSNGIAALPKDKKYVVYCHSGARSAKASQIMVDNGFADVSNVLGGISSYRGEIIKP